MWLVYLLCGLFCLFWMTGRLLAVLWEVGRMFADVWCNGVWPILRGAARAVVWLCCAARTWFLAHRHDPPG